MKYSQNIPNLKIVGKVWAVDVQARVGFPSSWVNSTPFSVKGQPNTGSYDYFRSCSSHRWATWPWLAGGGHGRGGALIRRLSAR